MSLNCLAFQTALLATVKCVDDEIQGTNSIYETMPLRSILSVFYFEVFTVRVIYFIVRSALTNGDDAVGGKQRPLAF